jgi:hypothetical protein
MGGAMIRPRAVGVTIKDRTTFAITLVALSGNPLMDRWGVITPS